MDPYDKKAPLVDLDCFVEWVIWEDDDLIVINKPGWLVCHPSKNGPLSSLVSAVREYSGMDKLHLVARLDRETSGLVLFAKKPSVARKFQMAIQARKVRKVYLAILKGSLHETITVDKPIARRMGGPVFIKSEVSTDRTAKSAITHFHPLLENNGYVLCKVIPETGRKHQIRVHAEHLNKRVVGDKIYGPDESLYINFIEHGWTNRMEALLPMKRQALHCYSYTFEFPENPVVFKAPLQKDMINFLKNTLNFEKDKVDVILNGVS